MGYYNKMWCAVQEKGRVARGGMAQEGAEGVIITQKDVDVGVPLPVSKYVPSSP